jgi:hypothetical protein
MSASHGCTCCDGSGVGTHCIRPAARLASESLTGQTDIMTWRVLEPLLLREGLGRDAPRLLDLLRSAIDAPNAAARRTALTAAAAGLGADGRAEKVLRGLAKSKEFVARTFALELAARLPQSPEAALLAKLRPLLRDRQVSTTVRLAAAIRLFRTAPWSQASRVLGDFATGFGRGRFLDRRAVLRPRFARRGRLFDRFADRLAERLLLRCPLCHVKLPRAAMARHLWERHQRLLVGRRIISPWRSIERWVDAGGVIHAHRALLRQGGHDEDSLTALRRDAAEHHAGVCPHCFATVQLDSRTAPAADERRPLVLAHGRLAGLGFAAELSRNWLGSRLRIETPAGIVFDGPEPGAPLRPDWRRWVTMPLFLLPIIIAMTMPWPWAVPGTLLGLLAVGWLVVQLRVSEPDERPDRVIDHAWRLLVPHLHADGFDMNDAEFAAGLAGSSSGRGDSAVREKPLQRLIRVTTHALRTGIALPKHLLALQSLAVMDAEANDEDPVRTTADAIGPWLTSPVPAPAELLLTHDVIGSWTKGQRARLRVLLTARAFESGLGVWDLHALGHALPHLGRVLHHEDTDSLARLRMLWDQRPTRPWKRCGPAATVFELANYPMVGGQHLEAAPDLLLFQPLPSGGEPIHLLACGRGLIVGGALIHEWPTSIDFVPLPLSKGGGYAMQFAGHAVQVHGDPAELVRKVTAWANYFFGEFLPWIGNVLAQPGDRPTDRLPAFTMACPDCGKSFLARRGEVGRPCA